MDDLTYTLRQLCQRNRDGSHATQADRQRSLILAARQLREASFRQMRATSLKGKHVGALLQRWQAEGLSVGTLKNRMAHLRWGGEKVGKAGILPADNTKLGIADRRYATNESKAKELGDGLARITDPYVRMSLRLRAALGLRREESIKFQPHYADRGDHIAGAADGTGRVPPAGRFGLADSGGQDLHPTAARLRWAMQGSRPEQHAGTPASVCADAV